MIIYPEGYNTQSRIHVLLLMIMYSRKLYLEDKSSSKQATTKSTTYKEVDYTFGTRLCSKGGVDFFLWWWNTFTNNSESPKPNCLPRYDPYQILFSQEDGWDLQEKALKETRRELKEERVEEHVQLLHKKGLWAWIPRWKSALDVQALFLIYL